jgi:hypothetical protein
LLVSAVPSSISISIFDKSSKPIVMIGSCIPAMTASVFHRDPCSNTKYYHPSTSVHIFFKCDGLNLSCLFIYFAGIYFFRCCW